jgi:hypothetical protein
MEDDAAWPGPRYRDHDGRDALRLRLDEGTKI